MQPLKTATILQECLYCIEKINIATDWYVCTYNPSTYKHGDSYFPLNCYAPAQSTFFLIDCHLSSMLSVWYVVHVEFI